MGELHHGLDAGMFSEESEIIELGEVTSGHVMGRQNDDQITICDLTGTGVQDTAISLLTVFQHRHQGSSNRQPGAVEGVHQLGLSAFWIAPPGLQPTGLKIPEVGTGRNLSVGPLPRQPDFQVVGHVGGKAEISTAQNDLSVGQLQRL